MNISINLKNERTSTRLVMSTSIGSNDHLKTNIKDKRDENKEKITISSQAHNMFNKSRLEKPMLQRLMEYKQNILEKRNDYVSNAMERGASPDEIKSGLDKMDEQVQDIDKQIQLLKQEELRNVKGLDDKKLKDDNGDPDKTSSIDASVQVTADTMKAVISTSNEVKQVKSVKMAQLTLRSEALNWASNPARFARLQKKADELDGKMIHTSQNAVTNMKQVIENSHEDTKTDEKDIVKPVTNNGNDVEGHPEISQKFDITL